MGHSENLTLALREARAHTDELFRLVCPGALYDRPIPERHRIIFYLGHLEAFDWNLVSGHAFALGSLHPEFDRLFAFGIDPPPGQLPCDEPRDWPSVAEVEQYNRGTRQAIDRVLDELPERLLHVAIEHRLMHAETFAYILHSLPYDKKVRTEPGAPAVGAGAPRHPGGQTPSPVAAPGNPTAGAPHHPGGQTPSPVAAPGNPTASAPHHRMIAIAAGPAMLGLAPGERFGWDNEFQAHVADVPAFSISKYKVTNGQYLEFVRQGAAPPFYWSNRGGQWFYRGMFEEIPLPPDCPVYVTHREAQAYAESCGMRLASEAEFHRAAAAAGVSSNAGFRHWDPIPVTADDEAGDSASPRQLVGNGWEWTSTVFAPFPGFQPFPFYTNYSAPFFDGAHYVLKGGSPRTAARLLRPSFRNWFRPEYPYVYATFRMVER